MTMTTMTMMLIKTTKTFTMMITSTKIKTEIQ
jgi:hypothetical protein